MAEIRPFVPDRAQAVDDLADQHAILVGAGVELARELHVHVDDAVALVEDANRLDVEESAAAVLGLEGAGQFNIGIGSHASSIPPSLPARHASASCAAGSDRAAGAACAAVQKSRSNASIAIGLPNKYPWKSWQP